LLVTAFRAVCRERLRRDARQHEGDGATSVGGVASSKHATEASKQGSASEPRNIGV